MERVWTPWRMAYIVGTDKSGCVFCKRQDPASDEAGYIVDRGQSVFTILNIYPYSVGHLMVCPFRHAGTWQDLTGEERRGLWLAAQTATAALERVYRPRAVHVGANLGRPAGAGVEGHLHLHLVPDSETGNLGDPHRPGVEDLPEPLDETYRKLRSALAGG